jgi:hypothetical protein
MYPIDPETHVLTQGFAENPDWYKGFIVCGKPLAGHNGDDWAPLNRANHPVYAVDHGTVSENKYDAAGFGNYVTIVHEWGRTRYAHFESRSPLKVGARVEPGDVIGIEGMTGNATSVHLHFGVYPNDEPCANGYGGAVDPKSWYARFPMGAEEAKGITIKPGPVKVLAELGLRVKIEPKIKSASLFTARNGTILTVGEETATDDDVIYRLARLWVAERIGGIPYLRNTNG